MRTPQPSDYVYYCSGKLYTGNITKVFNADGTSGPTYHIWVNVDNGAAKRLGFTLNASTDWNEAKQAWITVVKGIGEKWLNKSGTPDITMV